MSSKKNDAVVIEALVNRALNFEKEVKILLAGYESSSSRIITLDDTYKRLARLSVKQDQLIHQALKCIENNLFRASHVMAWAALMDYIEEKLASDGFVAVNSVYPSWRITSLDDLRDLGSDFSIIDALRRTGNCSKTEEKALKGLLSRRNECAHPTDYFPGLNESLGYISEVLGRLETFQKKWR